MNANDKIVTALTPGSVFNRNGLVFRSATALAEFAGLELEDLLELVNGELAPMLTCKASTKGKGILVALTAQVQEANAQADPGPFDGPPAQEGPPVVAEAPPGPGEPVVEVAVGADDPIEEEVA